MTSSVDRPNTLAGLVAKRAELVKYRDQLEADVKALTVDIDHLEAATVPRFLSRYRPELYPPIFSEILWLRAYLIKKGSPRPAGRP